MLYLQRNIKDDIFIYESLDRQKTEISHQLINAEEKTKDIKYIEEWNIVSRVFLSQFYNLFFIYIL